QLAGVADKSRCADFHKTIINKLLTGDVNYGTSEIGCAAVARFFLCATKIRAIALSKLSRENFLRRGCDPTQASCWQV
ncbi:MAG TPA: hypothetical protein VHM64_14480, partial [Candidatus Binatia bacterium]|nr:hypothetical protein [Candidatus Binatia bacterium]